jgi:hypothetical protein
MTILPLSRERRESSVQISSNRYAPLVGLQRLLCRLRVRDFQVTTDLDDEEVIDFFVPRNR